MQSRQKEEETMKTITLEQKSPAKTIREIVKTARKCAAQVAGSAEKIRTAEVKDSNGGGRWVVLVDGQTLYERGADKRLHGVQNAGQAALVATVLAKRRCKLPPAIRQIAADYVKSTRILAATIRAYNARLHSDPEFRLQELKKVEARRLEKAQKAVTSAKNATDAVRNAEAARAANEAAELAARLDAMDEADREADIAELLAS